jgi:hypothetical protein
MQWPKQTKMTEQQKSGPQNMIQKADDGAT